MTQLLLLPRVWMAAVVVAACLHCSFAQQIAQQCTPPCQNGGSCQQLDNSQAYACTCADTGFSGIDCSQPASAPPLSSQPASPCQPPCQNRGVCQQLDDSQSSVCNCANTGFQGISCSQPLTTSQAAMLVAVNCRPACQNGGVCQQLDNSQAYSCNCAGTNFGGINCADPAASVRTPAQAPSLAPSPCSPACQNGGVCQQLDDSQGFSCNCGSTGFQGIDCSQQAASTQAQVPTAGPPSNQPGTCRGLPCVQGTCRQSFNSQGYECRCSEGFTGISCNTPEAPDQQVSTASINAPQAGCGFECQNGGQCEQLFDSEGFGCRCAAGYSGFDCSRSSNGTPVDANASRQAGGSGSSGGLSGENSFVLPAMALV